MTKEQIETAMREGIPFLIKMADGEKYEVTERNQIALGNTRVVLVDKNDIAHILPLLTMTGITCLKPQP